MRKSLQATGLLAACGRGSPAVAADTADGPGQNASSAAVAQMVSQCMSERSRTVRPPCMRPVQSLGPPGGARRAPVIEARSISADLNCMLCQGRIWRKRRLDRAFGSIVPVGMKL